MNSLIVTGMSCNHCRESVLKAISAIPGVEEATVDLASGRLEWKGSASAETLTSTIIAIGFNVK